MIRLCALDDVPERDAKGFDSPEGEIVVARRDGVIYAYRNSCPHLGIGLNFQPDVFMDMDGEFIQCANHGALFRVEDGYCLAGPCSGQSLTALPIQVTDGDIVLLTETV